MSYMRVSFDDCPHKCTSGMIFNPYTGVSVPCPYCESKRKEKVNNIQSTKEEKSIYEILNITQPFTGSDFNIERVIPSYSLKYYVEESYSLVCKFLDEMFTMIGIGEYLDYSIMFNLGKKSHVENLIVPYMLKAYENGLKVAPYLDVLTLCNLRRSSETSGFSFTHEWGSAYNDYVDADICFVYIDTGVTQVGLDNVKGLMQIRASKGKPTYIVTDYWRRGISDILSEDDEKCLNLAYLVSVEYKKKEQEEDSESKSNKIEQETSRNVPTTASGMSREAFNNLVRDNKFF